MMNQGFSTDVQLINVASQGDLHNMADFPYGMALITAYLREQGFKTLMLQNPTWKNEEYIKKIIDNPAYLYGFQIGLENYVDVNDLVKLIKQNNPNAKIIFGGPFVVSIYKELLRIDPNLDAVVLGEGEYTIAELIKLLKEGSPDWKLIRGLAWLDDKGDVVVNPHRTAIQDMDAMPYAARDGIKEGEHDIEGTYMHDARITTSRGCTSNCTFCAVNINSKLQNTKRWRGRDPILVVDEIEELVKEYNVKMINFQDSAFDDPGRVGVERTKIICEEILKRGLEISIKIFHRANPIKEDPESIELYKLYKEAGIDVIIIGVEAGSSYELELYGKTATVEDNYRCFRVLRELDLFFNHVGIIMFGPYTTFSTLRANYKFLYENQLFYWYHNIDSSLILGPGAAMHDIIKKEGRLISRSNIWEYPDYEFESPEILKLAQHYQHIRPIYPHIDVGNPLVLKVENIISRLKNKMNRKIAVGCEQEIIKFKENYYKNK
ncbi:MAG: radical SAM protein, partial [Candidatus Scalindua sp.]|nr:radical SAM protein [Candidatus Scalindua sp.]